MVDETETVETTDEQIEQTDETQTYPADIVRKLREENAKYRTRAHDAEARVDELTRALFTARVQATGKLADPSDLPFDADLLDDDNALNAAVDDLIAKRPHYAKRKIVGDVGQGRQDERKAPTTFTGLFSQ